MTRRALLLFLVALAGLAVPTSAQTTVLAFGDSITLGVGDTDPDEEGYPTRLKPLLVAGGFSEVRVENHGVAGEETARGLSRINSVLDRGGDYILIMQGTNDILSKMVSPETISFNLAKMVDKAKSARVTPILATVIPLRPSAETSQDFALAKKLRQRALSEKVDLADNYAVFDLFPNAWPDLYNTDRRPDRVGHPNAAGYDLLAASFADAILDRDSVPPVLGDVKPVDGASGVSKTAAVTVVLFDHGRGIDTVATRMLINGSPVTAERSGSKTKSTYTYSPSEPFNGVVEVEMEVRDQAVPANTASYLATRFSVKGTTFLKGDVNQDGRVDGYDLVSFAFSFGSRQGDGRYRQVNDLDKNGVVNGADLAILANNFGKSSG